MVNRQAVSSRHGRQRVFMWFKGPKILSGRWWEIEVEGCRVLVSRIEGVPEVHEEGIAFPSEAILDERIRISSPM
jgi:hypothetical protein